MPRQLSLLLVATQFLTHLPVPTLAGFENSWRAQSARDFSLVGALVGWMGIGVWNLASLVFPTAGAAEFSIGATLLLTGAFHEDGFADVCDGVGGGRSRASILAIMKDSRVGAFAVLGVVMMLGLKWVTLISLPAGAVTVAYVTAHLQSRRFATALMWRLRYVRVGDDAKSRPLAYSLGTLDWMLSGALGATALRPLWLIGAPAAGWPPILLAAIACAAGVALLAALYFKHRIGGYTGDGLGAVQQLSEIGFLLGVLAMLDVR